MNEPPTPRQLGIQAFRSGQDFGTCPLQGFREEQIELRWQWQKGWLWAETEQREGKKP